MAFSSTESHLQNNNNFTHFMQSTSSNFFSLFTPHNPHQLLSTPFSTSTTSSSSSLCVPLLFSNSLSPLPPIISLSTPTPTTTPPHQSDSLPSNSNIKPMSSGPESSGFPSTVRIAGLHSSVKGGGPAFVGQVFSMCDLSGTGLMAVSKHIEIPFLSKRIPEWIKKMFSMVTKNENNGPVFRFFMDLGDAVSYVKQVNIPTGVVGACRLDLAYEHFKEKPHMFQFVPNEKQVKEANKILKTIPQSSGRRMVDGVPVFTAQNLDIAIATSDGIKWYTPYFFDKSMLDNILEDSVDQHFHSLIQSRHMQRRRDVIDDNLTAEVVEENGDNLWEPPEVQEVLDEMGHPGLPLSVISKAAEMQLLYTVDKVLLGNRWLRKATGIQPKFPYMVDSFEKRTAASFLKASEATIAVANKEEGCDNDRHGCRNDSSDQGGQRKQINYNGFRFPFGDWFSNLWSKQQQKPDKQIRMEAAREECIKQLPLSPLLPKITMVGISTGEAGQTNRASLKKTMEDLTRELEQPGQNSSDNSSSELREEDRDPLFVANVGDYYSSMAKAGSGHWTRGGNK